MKLRWRNKDYTSQLFDGERYRGIVFEIHGTYHVRAYNKFLEECVENKFQCREEAKAWLYTVVKLGD